MLVGKKHQNETIVEFVEAFEFKERIWLILELMDRDILTSIIENDMGKYDEDFIRYVMLRVVQGIAFLHQ